MRFWNRYGRLATYQRMRNKHKFMWLNLDRVIDRIQNAVYLQPLQMEINKYQHSYGKRPSASPFNYFRYSWIMMLCACQGLWSWTLYDHERQEFQDGNQPAQEIFGGALLNQLWFGWVTYFLNNFFWHVISMEADGWISEGEEMVMRLEQQRRFKKKKDKRFDFLSIGVFEIYPYPK